MGEPPPLGVTTIAVYRPIPGSEAELDACVRDHLPILRELKLASDRSSTVLRAPDGAIVEIFEWASQAAIDSAHHDPAVLALWQRFGACCTFGTLAALPGAETPFPSFVRLDL